MQIYYEDFTYSDINGSLYERRLPRRGHYLVSGRTEYGEHKDAVAVYRRLRDSGHMASEGLTYVSSWVDDKIECCFQLMETHDRKLLDQWMANWSDLINFEVFAVVTSNEAAKRMAPLP